MSCLNFSTGLLVSSLWLDQHCSFQKHASSCLTVPYQVPGVNCLAKWLCFHSSTNLKVALYSKLTLIPSTPQIFPEIFSFHLLHYNLIPSHLLIFSHLGGRLHIHLLFKKFTFVLRCLNNIQELFI